MFPVVGTEVILAWSSDGDVKIQMVVCLTQRRLMDPAAVVSGLPPVTPDPAYCQRLRRAGGRTHPSHRCTNRVEGEHPMSAITPQPTSRRPCADGAAWRTGCCRGGGQACRRLPRPTIRAVLGASLKAPPDRSRIGEGNLPAQPRYWIRNIRRRKQSGTSMWP